MVEETKNVKKGLNWALEILVFIAVFLVCNIAMTVVMLPAEMVMLFSDKNYLQAVMAGDMEMVMEIAMEVSASEGLMLVMLFAESIMIVLTCLFCRFIQKRKMTTMGFVKKGMLKEYLAGLLAGFGCFSLAVLLGVLTGALKAEGFFTEISAGMLVLYFIGFMIQGMAEEVLCRGYFLVSYARRYPVYAAVLANSVAFAALHLFNDGISILSFINLVLFGVFASVYFIRRGNIWGIGAFHAIWNFAQGNFYGIRVSGMEIKQSVLNLSSVEGKELLSGGTFGLEGSILVTIVLTAGILVCYFWKKKETETETA